MRFSISVVSKNRMYTKAYRRVMEDLHPLIDELESVEMICPLGDAVLIMVSDGDQLLPNEVREVSNNDEYFQYAAGIRAFINDIELTKDLFSILRSIVEKVPFSAPDHERYRDIFSRWESHLQ